MPAATLAFFFMRKTLHFKSKYRPTPKLECLDPFFLNVLEEMLYYAPKPFAIDNHKNAPKSIFSKKN